MKCSKDCLYCGNTFYKKSSNSKKYWETKMYCSMLCNNKSRIGTTQSADSNKKRSASMKGKRNSLGCKRSLEWRKHLSEYWKNNIEKNPRYKGKVRTERETEGCRLEFRLWKEAVLERDNHTCVLCGSKEKITTDHVKAWALFPEFRYDVNNGRTLCWDCHKSLDKVISGKGSLTQWKKDKGLMKPDSIAKGKKVIDSVTGKVYESIIDAANYLGMRPLTLQRCLAGRKRNNTTMNYFLNKMSVD